MKRSITTAFKSGLDKAYSQLGDGVSHPEVLMVASRLKSSLKEENTDIKYLQPNFEREFDEAKRYREFEGLSKKKWIEIAKKGTITTFERIKKNLGNVDFDFEKLDRDKRARFQADFKNKKIEAPIAVKLNKNHYDLLAGNTRLAGLLKHGINPKIWLIDATKTDKVEAKEQDKVSAKKQFSQDLQQDSDFIEFKKRAKYKQDNKDFNFGTPNVSSDDPFISKKKFKHVGKGEYAETTGASSAGSYVGPFATNSKFVQKSNSETPKSELGEVQYDNYDLQTLKVATNSDGNTFRVGDKAIAFDRFKPIRIISLQKDNRDKVMAYHREGDFMASVNIDGLIPLGKQVSKIEANEVTGASSAGQYSGPAMWAKSTSKKDWRGASKPLYKGGKFVQVKGKCKKFPYCNQGDIKALRIWENENIKTAIKRVCENTGLSDITIKGILQYEMNNIHSKKV